MGVAVGTASKSMHGAAALLAFYSLAACGDADQGGPGGSAGNDSATGASSSNGGATGNGGSDGGSTGTVIPLGGNGQGGAPPPFVCDPPAEPGSLFELSAESQDIDIIDPVSMCQYRGDVLLIVNVAAM